MLAAAHSSTQQHQLHVFYCYFTTSSFLLCSSSYRHVGLPRHVNCNVLVAVQVPY